MATPFRIGGRIVWSGGKKPLEAYQLRDVITKQPRFKKGGVTPRMARSFGLAIPSDQFLSVIWPIMYAEAQRFFPHGTFPQNFAWKYKDSNTYDKGDPAKGVAPKLYSEREGWAGCHVLSVQSEFDDPTPVFIWQNGAWVSVPWDSLKTGDYIELSGSIEAHNEATPGLYVNPAGIQVTLIGQAILGGSFDPTAAFGTGPAQAPAGAVGEAPAAMGVPGAPPAPAAAPGLPPPPASAPGQPSGGFTPPPAAPAAVPPPANGAGMPTSSPGIPTASPTSALPPPPAAPPVNGFHAGQPQMPPPAPAAAPGLPPPPAAPPAAPARTPAGVDSAGRPYYLNAAGNAYEY